MTNRKRTARLQKVQRPPRPCGRRAAAPSTPCFDLGADPSGNFNTVVIGRTGSGKSVFLSELTVQFATTGATHLGKENLR